MFSNHAYYFHRMSLTLHNETLSRPLQDLTVFEQAWLQSRVGDVLHGRVLVHGHGGQCGGGLSEDHEHRLHADRAVGDVRTGHAHGYQ